MPVPKGFKERKLKFPSEKCDSRSFRIKVQTKNRRIVICCPKGEWNAKRKRCRVGTRGVSLQTRKKSRRK